MKLYHVTPAQNVKSILATGLLPQIGNYARQMGETTASIWLFSDIDDCLEMTEAWLIPVYGDDLTILEVTLPDDFPLEYTGSDYEVFVVKPISADHIKVYQS